VGDSRLRDLNPGNYTAPMAISEELLIELQRLSDHATPGPWTPWVEGRDHLSGSDFVMVNDTNGSTADLEINLDGMPASTSDLDLVAVARTYLPELISEIRSLRAQLGGPSTVPPSDPSTVPAWTGFPWRMSADAAYMAMSHMIKHYAQTEAGADDSLSTFASYLWSAQANQTDWDRAIACGLSAECAGDPAPERAVDLPD